MSCMDDHNLRRHPLGSKKTGRFIFATMSEAKVALEATTKSRCANGPALINSFVEGEAFRRPDPTVRGGLVA